MSYKTKYYYPVVISGLIEANSDKEALIKSMKIEDKMWRFINEL